MTKESQTADNENDVVKPREAGAKTTRKRSRKRMPTTTLCNMDSHDKEKEDEDEDKLKPKEGEESREKDSIDDGREDGSSDILVLAQRRLEFGL